MSGASALRPSYDAFCDGRPAATIQTRTQAFEDRRELLEAEPRPAQAPAPRLHPNLATLYRQRVTQPTTATHDDAVRALAEEAHLVLDGHEVRVALRGELASILALPIEVLRRNSVLTAAAMVSLAQLH